ncbi:zinc finger, CCHC-type containing protein [Tanacetum coccineum]
MAAAAMKHMASNFAKLDKFEGVDFRRWQKKMHFLLSSMSVVYVLTTPIPEDGGDDATVEQIRKRAKWDNDDYVCRGLILNGMSDSLFDIYQNVESSKELWDSLEAKYMAEDASSKKFLVSNFTNYKMTDSRPVLEQYNELLGILGRFTQHKMNMDEAIQVSCIIDKLPPSWKDFKHTLKHLKEELTLVELGSHLRIKESLRAQDNDKPKVNNVIGPSVVNMSKVTCWKCGKPGHLKKDCKGGKSGNKANGSGTKGSVDGSSNSLKGKTKVLEPIHSDLCDLHATPSLGNKKYFVTFIDDASRFCYVYLLHSKDEALDKFQSFNMKLDSNKGTNKRFRTDSGAKTLLGERGIECIFVGYAEHSKAFRFYVIEPNSLVLINSIIESRDAIFDKNRFSSVPRPSLRIPNGTKDIGGSVVPKEVTEEDDPKTFDEAMKSQDVAFWKEAINDEMDSIMGNNTWVLADLPPGCKPLGCKWIFKRKLKVDGTIEKFKARLVIQGFKQKSGIDYFDTYALVARISTIRLLIAMVSIHNLIIHQLDAKTAFLNGDLDEETPKQWHQKFNELVLSNGYLLNQANKCVYSKFDETGKGVIICLYVDDMLIFGTDQVHVGLIKEFLSLRVIGCLMYVMTCTRPDIAFAISKLSRYTSNPGYMIATGISNTRRGVSQSHYIEKVLKKFNYFDCTPVSTPMNTSEKLKLNNGQAVSQLEYTSNSGTQHWQAFQQVLKYLKKTMDYRLTYTGYPSVVVYIGFVRSQRNLADHLTKGLARGLVLKSVEGMRLKSN